ncbi:AraC family transcriptional regulator [Sphingobacterium sp. UT-1RO-CII-1]|uniref:AraC family transcriptional regulator n=1 Tax=Sphingobacterium sp. UT-1RO-CII-1 TaxID=2995225 RepID=UPI00227C3AB8|nr:AraC family transcriptional regulator [Sphingobacterium sp. UT-1RO-CII-1]MCY4781348.1 AraC family transcriptional regulator [Sphingobacterium sp. UT-1RO-CII-1]
MYIQRLNHTQKTKYSLSIRHDNRPQNNNLWHYHEELEFIYIKKGRGTFFVGDHIQHFTDGYIVLIGANTPHYWFFDDEFTGASPTEIAEIIVLHFRADFIGTDFLQSQEATPIRKIFQIAQKALSFSPKNNDLTAFFNTIIHQAPLKQLIELLNILNAIHYTIPYNTLVSKEYSNPQQEHDHLRMNKIIEYIRLHYKSQILLQDISHLADMTSNSFCRYFKQKTGKTLVQFVNEIRINEACKLLKNTEKLIKNIAFDCGFQNFVSFHKKFKEITGKTPIEFRKTSSLSSE